MPPSSVSMMLTASRASGLFCTVLAKSASSETAWACSGVVPSIAAAALSASLVLSPLSATSLQVFAANTTTQQYIEANNRALINNDSIDPVSYVHNIQNLTGDPIQSRVTKYVEYYLDGTDSEGSQMSFPSPYKYVYDANKNQIQFAYSDGGNDDNPCVYTYQYD